MNASWFGSLALLALMGLSLSGQSTSLRFENRSEEAAISVPTREPFVSFGDYDSDGDPDLMVDGRRLFRNDSKNGKIIFTDVSQEAGLAKARGPSGCWFDFDRDGWLDFGTASGEVWINNGKGAFIDFSSELGIHLPHGSASAIAWGDVNGDGWLDLFTGGNNTYNPTRHYPQSCWLNTKRRKPLCRIKRKKDRRKIAKMRDVSKAVGVGRKIYGRAIGFCDFDWDGDDDVYSGNYHLAPNGLFLNDGGHFEESAKRFGVAGRYDQTMFTIEETGEKIGYRYGHTIGAAWADLNNDGYFDLWVSNLAHKYSGQASASLKKALGRKIDIRGYICDDSNLFINDGPPHYHFHDRRIAMGIPSRPIGKRGVFQGDELWSNAVCGDLDNNGWIDAFCNQIYGDLSYSFGVLYANEEGHFREVHKDAGVEIWGGYGSAIADMDSDGRLDLIVCGSAQLKAKPAIHVFRNISEKRPWIGFDLLERRGLQVVGAKVLLVQEHGVQLRQLSTTTGTQTQQNDGRIHFGLGSGGPIQGVFVYWPDGSLQSLGTPKTDRYHRVRKRTARRKPLRLFAPKQAKTGEVVVIRVKGAARKAHFDWDFQGSRLPEQRSEAPEASFRFSQAGEKTVWVRAVGANGMGSEGRTRITIVEK